MGKLLVWFIFNYPFPYRQGFQQKGQDAFKYNHELLWILYQCVWLYQWVCVQSEVSRGAVTGWNESKLGNRDHHLLLPLIIPVTFNNILLSAISMKHWALIGQFLVIWHNAELWLVETLFSAILFKAQWDEESPAEMKGASNYVKTML